MRAIQIDRFGGPEVLQLRDLPRPEPGADEVLVQIEIAGVNFADIDHRRGERGTTVPMVPGTEGVGEVVERGSEAEGVTIGQRVSFWNPGAPGTYAEFAVVPATRLLAVPEDIPSPIAAGLSLQGLTAHALTRGMYPSPKAKPASSTPAPAGSARSPSSSPAPPEQPCSRPWVARKRQSTSAP